MSNNNCGLFNNEGGIDTSLLFFFLLLVIIFCNCGKLKLPIKKDSLGSPFGMVRILNHYFHFSL